MSPDLDHPVSRAHQSLSAAVVATATIGAGALWPILSMATGLIFHFMPGAPMLAAVWVRRAYGPDVPIPWRSLWAHIEGGIGVTVVIAIIIERAGGAFDAVVARPAIHRVMRSHFADVRIRAEARASRSRVFATERSRP